jgi:hypothetical protein
LIINLEQKFGVTGSYFIPQYPYKMLKKSPFSQMWCLMSETLATWEVEIRKSAVQDQPGQKVSKTPCQPKAGMVVPASYPRHSEKLKIRRSRSRPAWAKNKILSPK